MSIVGQTWLAVAGEYRVCANFMKRSSETRVFGQFIVLAIYVFGFAPTSRNFCLSVRVPSCGFLLEFRPRAMVANTLTACRIRKRGVRFSHYCTNGKKKVALIVCIWFQVLQYFKKTRNIWWHGPERSISRAYTLKRQ